MKKRLQNSLLVHLLTCAIVFSVPTQALHGFEVDIPFLRQSCSAHKSCNECTTSSSFCHWCEFDKKCHSIGSFSGCLYGIDCDTIGRCEIRQEGWFGFSEVTFNTMIVLGFFSFLFALCCCCRKRIIVYQNSQNYMAIPDTSISNNEMQTAAGFVNLYEHVPQYQRASLPASNDTARIVVENPSTCFNWIMRIFLACFLAALVVSIVAFFPKSPEIDFCSSKVAWNDIIQSIINLNLMASFQILISVYNPNPYDIILNFASGSFYYKGEKFGSYEVAPMTIKALSITDDLVTTTFTPDNSQAFEIIEDFWNGDLNFTVGTQFQFTLPSLFNLSYEDEFNASIVSVGSSNDNDDNFDVDQSLCTCPLSMIDYS